MKTRTSIDRVAETIGEECLAARTRLINRTITGIYDEALRPLGLTANQLTVLVIIARRGPIAPREIAERLNMEKSTVSRNIALMRKNGWVNMASPEAGHGQHLTLSKPGRALVKKSLPAWELAQTQAKVVLGQGGADSILTLGDAVRKSQSEE